MSWKLIQPHFLRLQGWELAEGEVPAAVKVAVAQQTRPPFFTHLHSHLCPSHVAHSRLWRFLRALDATSPTVFLYSLSTAVTQLRTPMQPHWTFDRSHKVELLLALQPLLRKPEFAAEARDMVSALCHLLLCEDGESLTPAEAARVMLDFAQLDWESPALEAIVALAKATVINSVLEIDTETLMILRENTQEEVVKAVIEEAVKRRQEPH